MKLVYTIVEKEGYEKDFWVRIGTAFENRDGSQTIFLDTLPVNGKLHVRERKKKEGNASNGPAQDSGR